MSQDSFITIVLFLLSICSQTSKKKKKKKGKKEKERKRIIKKKKNILKYGKVTNEKSIEVKGYFLLSTNQETN